MKPALTTSGLSVELLLVVRGDCLKPYPVAGPPGSPWRARDLSLSPAVGKKIHHPVISITAALFQIG
jgi:hypothetical protein